MHDANDSKAKYNERQRTACSSPRPPPEPGEHYELDTNNEQEGMTAEARAEGDTEARRSSQLQRPM
eukprot:14429250-Alexandrium_andersonii.AAC.1